VWAISSTSLPLLNLGPGDIHSIPIANLNFTYKGAFSELADIPLNKKRFFALRLLNNIVVISHHGCHEVASSYSLSLFNITESDIIHLEDYNVIERNFFPCSFARVDERFHNGTLFRVSTERQVYVIMDGLRVAVPSISVLVKYGWDFSKIVVIPDAKMLDFIPLRMKELD